LEDKNNISQELLETIERYLKNTMTADEHTSFEKQLEESPILRQQVDETKMLFSGIKKAVLKKKLHTFHEELEVGKSATKRETKVFKLNFKTLSVAATVLILVGGFWFFNRPSKNDRLFNTYFEKFYYLGLAYIKDEKRNLAIEMLKKTTAIETKELITELEQ